MMNNIEIIREIREFLQKNADPAIHQKYSYYFKEGFDSYGVHQDVFMEFMKILRDSEIKSKPINEVISLGNELFSSGKYEEGSITIMFLAAFKKSYSLEVFDEITRWLDSGIHNWAHCDYFCSEIISVFYKKNIIDLNYLSNWRKADSKWKRRATPVSMLTLLKSEHNIVELLQFIDIMMDDKERVVHQGLGWFLREAWKKNPERVEEFLHKWKNDAARLIFQYATEKMEKEYRVRFRKDKNI